MKNNLFTPLFASICFSFCLISALNYAQDTAIKYKAWISTKNGDGYLNVAGNFENNSEEDISISYMLISSRDGQGGTSSTTQKGNAEIRTKEKSVLSSVKINAVKNDFYTIKLIIYKDKRVIGSDSVVYKL